MKDLNLDKLNSQLMPTANEIKQKMENLQKKYNFELEEFSFKPITMEELTDPNLNI